MEQEMEYIHTIYECGSFSKAAEKLYVTQPALSLAVKRTEERIGMQLFDRSGRTLKLTEAGKIYIRKYYEIHDLEEEMQKQINDLSSLETGEIRIGGTNYFNSYVLPPVIVAFKNRYPGISLELTEAGSYELLEMLKEHRIDLTFNCGLTPKDPFIRRKAVKDMILLAVPKNFEIDSTQRAHALSHTDILAGRHITAEIPSFPLAAFTSLPFILLTERNNLYWRYQEICRHENISLNAVMQVNQLATAWHLACSGLGATLISDRLVTGSSDSVIFFRIDSVLCERQFELIMSEKHYVSHAMKAFSDIFCDHYKEKELPQ